MTAGPKESLHTDEVPAGPVHLVQKDGRSGPLLTQTHLQISWYSRYMLMRLAAQTGKEPGRMFQGRVNGKALLPSVSPGGPLANRCLAQWEVRTSLKFRYEKELAKSPTSRHMNTVLQKQPHPCSTTQKESCKTWTI